MALEILLILAVPAFLIARQPDLGTALLVAASGGFVLFLSGLHWRLIAGLAGVAAAAAPALWFVMRDYQRQRVLTFLDPESDPLGSGWNIIQSKIAVGSGGLLGKGWLNGTQSRLEFIPERHTDFILAVLSEEFGLLGVLLMFCLYLFIAGRGLHIASLARTTYARLLAGSLVRSSAGALALSLGALLAIDLARGFARPLRPMAAHDRSAVRFAARSPMRTRRGTEVCFL